MAAATVVRQLQLRRDLKANMPAQLAEGEPFYCTDTDELFVGKAVGNEKMSIQYTPAVTGNWAGSDPANLVEAMDRVAALLVTLNGGPIP